MKNKKFLATLLALAMLASFSACKGTDNEEPSTDAPTVTGGSVDDVFALSSGNAEEGEEPTIDSDLVDGDTGEVTTKSGYKATTAAPVHNVNKEKPAASNVQGTSTSKGYSFSWAPVAGAKKYNIYRAETKDGEYKYIGSTEKTSYVDESNTGTKQYYYKVTVAPEESSTTTTKKPADNSSGFKGFSVTFVNEDDKQTTISSKLNNSYVAFIRNEYSKKGITCPPGRLAYVAIPGSEYIYVFQFDNDKKWNSNTLEQVQIFVDQNNQSKYFSFFTKDTGSSEYLAAKKNAETEWDKIQKKGGSNKAMTYGEMQATFVALAGDPHFQETIDKSY